MVDHTRDPCPWVILNDFGGAFAMGVSFVLLSLEGIWSVIVTNFLLVDRWCGMAWRQGIPEFTYGMLTGHLREFLCPNFIKSAALTSG